MIVGVGLDSSLLWLLVPVGITIGAILTAAAYAAAAGAAISGATYGIRAGIEGEFDAGDFFKSVGIGAGGGALGGAGGAALGSLGGAASSASASAASNVAATGGDIAAASAAPGTFGSTGPAAAAGVGPSGASAGLGAEQTIDQALASGIGKSVEGAVSGPSSASNQIATDLARSYGVRPQIEGYTQAGQHLADNGVKVASGSEGFPGPSYPQFQNATEVARGGAASPYNLAASGYGPQAPGIGSRLFNIAGRSAVNAGVSAIQTRDPRQIGTSALAGAVSGLTSTGLNEIVPRYGSDLLSDQQVGGVSASYGRFFEPPYAGERPTPFPSTPSNQIATGMHQADMVRGYGVGAMDTVRQAGIGQASSRAGGSVSELLARRPQAGQALPTSGPALYAAMRPQVGQGLYRYLRRA